MKTEHTPLPWKAQRSWERYGMTREDAAAAGWDDNCLNGPFVAIVGPDDQTVVNAHDLFTFRPGDADLIVLAVNHHARLVAALRDCSKAFACWQVGQIPGRPEDILALTSNVRALLAEIGAAE